MIFGALGLLSGQMFGLPGSAVVTARQIMIRRVLSGFLLLVLLGLSPNVDVIAHVGGFCWGVLFGALLARWPNLRSASWPINRLAEVLCAGLVVFTWWKALA